MSTTSIELVTYRLKSGVSKLQLADNQQALNDFLTKQAGFLYRSNSEDEDGLLYDIVFWQSLEYAQAAGKAFMEDPAGQALMALTDEGSITMRHMKADSEAMADCGKAA